MSDLDHFDLLPIAYDAATKKAVIETAASRTNPASTPRALRAELDHLNELHAALQGLESGTQSSGGGGVPPAPIPVNPTRSTQVAKLRDNGNAEYRKQRPAEAARLYTLGLRMALQRPLWEPSALAREEAAAMLANRAQARMALREWPAAATDALASVEARRVGNARAWWRRGRCLREMGRLDEAAEWVRQGLEVEGEEAELVELRNEIDACIERAVRVRARAGQQQQQQQ